MANPNTIRHYASDIAEHERDSFTICGRLVVNEHLYRGDDPEDRITCKQCQASLRKEDRELDARIYRGDVGPDR